MLQTMQYASLPHIVFVNHASTYQIQWWIETGSTAYLNRPVNLDANGANQASTITVMEIAG